MQPIISQVCTLGTPFEKDLEALAAAQCQGVEIWLTKLEQFLERHSIDEVQRRIEESGLTAPVAGVQGGLFGGGEAARGESWQLFGRRLELCRQLGIGTLVVSLDLTDPADRDVLQRVRRLLHEMAVRAERHGVAIALEFQASASWGNNLQTAAALVGEVGHPHLGLCLDAFHFYVGPSKSEDLALLTTENLLHVQLCDLADVPRELARDADRILPGDGDIPLEQIVARLRAIDYRRAVSLELMNPQIWQIPAVQIGEIGITALRKVLGLASMGEASR